MHGAKKSAYAAVAAIVLAALFDRGLPRVKPSANDLHLDWLLDGERYFTPDERPGALTTDSGLVALDNGVEEFQAKKSSGTFRIFCIGGSTTRGWPFHPVISYPKLLSRRLADVLPGRRVEVINAGFMAHDSWSDVSLVRELLQYEPDLLLIYEGRNEFYNFSLHDGWRGVLLKAHVRLFRHFRFYGWLRRRLAPTLDGEPDHAESIRAWARRGMSNGEDEVNRALAANLDHMRQDASAAGVPIALLTQVTSDEAFAGYDDGHMRRLNGRLTEYGARRSVPVIDVDGAIADAERAELVIPYPMIHPDLRGYSRMADVVARGLGRRGLLGPGSRWRWDRLRTDDEYLRVLGLSSPFLAEAYRKVSRLFQLVALPEQAQRYLSKAEREAARR